MSVKVSRRFGKKTAEGYLKKWLFNERRSFYPIASTWKRWELGDQVVFSVYGKLSGDSGLFPRDAGLQIYEDGRILVFWQPTPPEGGE